MNRIEVSSAISGPANFTFGANPSFYDAQDNANISKVESIHGADTWQKSSWDGRIRTFRWEGQSLSDTNMSTIVAYFRSIEGSIRYFNFKDIVSMNDRWPVTGDWKKARVITVNIKYRAGGALKYDTVELQIQPEQ